MLSKILFAFVLGLFSFASAKNKPPSAATSALASGSTAASVTPIPSSTDGLIEYVSSGEAYTNFKRKFPNVRLQQSGSLTEAQKIFFNNHALSTIYDNYTSSFISRSGFTTVVVHADSSRFCASFARGNCSLIPAGWAYPASGVLNVVAESAESSATAQSRGRITEASCNGDSQCLSLWLTQQSNSRTIHHELFHSIDREHASTTWVNLSPRGSINPENSTVSSYSANLVGFVSEYASTATVEDRAETFAHTMMEPSLVALKGRTDSYVQSKLLGLKTFLEGLCGRDITCRIPEQFQNIESPASNPSTEDSVDDENEDED